MIVVQPRHPRVLAAQAQTVQAASHGRLALGLGISHPGLLEVYGIPFVRPVAALRAHPAVITPILDGEAAVPSVRDRRTGLARHGRHDPRRPVTTALHGLRHGTAP